MVNPASFTHPVVRDLAWVMHSPGLVDERVKAADKSIGIVNDQWCRDTFARNRAWLNELDAHPAPLLQWLDTHRYHRLGNYFELLIEYWLLHIFSPVCWVPHWQVRAEKHTVGEFDFVFATRDSRPHHWEVAVKYYLYHRDSNGIARWYGPNPEDRLDIKLQRLFDHQLTLSAQPQGKLALEKLGLPDVRPELFIKGYLFYPSRMPWQKVEAADPAIAVGHGRGWWTNVSEFRIPAETNDSRWVHLPRLRWLSAAAGNFSNEKQLLDLHGLHNYCLKRFKKRTVPLLFAEVQKTQSDLWKEISRGFVVPTGWPVVSG
jgi:hypothetical protein